MQAVNRIESLRALGVGTSGFPLPFTLDPTVVLSGTGVIEPVPQRRSRRDRSSTLDLARHQLRRHHALVPIRGSRGDRQLASPRRSPIIQTAKAIAFVPFSIEAGQDWPTLEHELAGLLRDSKNVLEATQFLTGTARTSRAASSTSAAPADSPPPSGSRPPPPPPTRSAIPWLLKAALPARFMPNIDVRRSARHLGHDLPLRRRELDRAAASSTTTAAATSSAGRRSSGRRWRPAPRPRRSSSSLGDFKTGYMIVDRFGDARSS